MSGVTDLIRWCEEWLDWKKINYLDVLLFLFKGWKGGMQQKDKWRWP